MVAFVGSGGFAKVRRSGAAVSSRRGTWCAQAEATEVKPTMWGDGTDGSACPPADTEFAKKYGHLRGAKIPTVTDTMAKFNENFSRPVPSVYRSIVNEIITLGHLTSVCAMWHYDAVFAYGFDEIFQRYFQYYPSSEERERLISCIVNSIPNLDLDTIRKDGQSVRDWLEGKSGPEVLEQIESGSSDGPVLSAFSYIKSVPDYEWYYSRNFGFGLIFMMEKLKVELTDENAERWAKAIGVSPVKVKDEVAVYISSLERLKQAEQMFADLAAREKKKAADILDEQAKKAQQEADEAEKDVDNA
eukprot:Plantae.Rhodophyta-Purpureofilum_apyrenoidigerum.ctg24671.p1 GENE.Plantae.Rhodophyta-Purpureofilum_apyrenoidigerum.ctg24671~~Plantae.Rhodophyta-Purpureofilum_apyrenoidigerum.ctg24671.p1  ORF type:complete len:302 (+),score=71.56 Plantae.Rhodophyta-Purpureofilum_apyrenoidigerum.ctg24671:147-1052(+)